MKTLIVILFITLTSCNSDVDNQKIQSTPNNYGIMEVEFDGCQYIIYKGFKKAGLTHKGNCINTSHKLSK
jgi:hypothetical protein